MSDKTVIVRLYQKTRDRLKIRAAKEKKPMTILVDELSKKVITKEAK